MSFVPGVGGDRPPQSSSTGSLWSLPSLFSLGKFVYQSFCFISHCFPGGPGDNPRPWRPNPTPKPGDIPWGRKFLSNIYWVPDPNHPRFDVPKDVKPRRPEDGNDCVIL